MASEELGVSARDLRAELKAGATIAESLDQAVEQGAIPRADADGMLAKVQS